MRQLVSSLLTGGGFLAVLAFFLPWASVCCDGTPLASVSPYDRAVGVRAETAEVRVGGHVADVEPEVSMPPERGYFLLLCPGLLAAAAGLALLSLRRFDPLHIGGVAAAASGVGLYTAVRLGLIEHLGLDALVAADMVAGDTVLGSVAVGSETGIWVAIGGYVLALGGAACALLLAGRLDAA